MNLNGFILSIARTVTAARARLGSNLFINNFYLLLKLRTVKTNALGEGVPDFEIDLHDEGRQPVSIACYGFEGTGLDRLFWEDPVDELIAAITTIITEFGGFLPYPFGSNCDWFWV